VDKSEEIERLIEKHGILNKDYARKWLGQGGGIAMEEKAKDIAAMERNLVYAQVKRDFPDSYHNAVIVGCGDEFIPSLFADITLDDETESNC